MTTESPLVVACEATPNEGGGVAIRYTVTNRGPAPLHLFDSRRMPYLLQEADGSLVVLHGVHAPPPGVDPVLVEIPLTRPLDAGASFAATVDLGEPVLHDHYGRQRQPLVPHGSMGLVCRVGWGESAITPRERARMGLPALLAWQHLAEAPRLRVNFP